MTVQPPQLRLFSKILKDSFDTAPDFSDHPIDDEDLLLRWADRTLPENDQSALLGHLAQCPNCRKEVSAMIKNGILEFREPSVQPVRPYFTITRTKKIRSRLLIGAFMTSTLCLLLCLFFLQGEPKQPQVAHNEGETPSVDLDLKLGGATRSATEPDKFALLVGINKYAKLKEGEWLEGCHNDIISVESVITERFGFDKEHVTVLLDEQATADGLRAGMKKLVEKIQARPDRASPAQVLFYFSGHGSRVLDQPEGDPDCDSEDGFDSTLVVYDSERQGSDSDIRDDELNKFAHAICKGGKAELLIALDSCHSGGGARGITKFRGIDRNLDRQSAATLKNRKTFPKNLPEGTVFLSACQSNQKEPEYDVEGKKYGLFSYHFTRLLRAEQLVSSLDYGTLKDVIHRSYQRNKIAQAPTPTIEGSPKSLRRSVLGADYSIDRNPYWEVKRNGKERDTVRIEAGRINDMSVQSLFELYETPDQAIDTNAESLGWLRITKVDGNHSIGTFFQWKLKNGEERTDQIDTVLTNDFKVGFAVERYHDFGDNFLAVRVMNSATGATITPNDPSVPESVRALLLESKTKGESSWIRWTGENESCDLVLKYDEQAKLAAVFPATGCADDNREPAKTRGEIMIPEGLRGGWGPVEWGTEKGKDELQDTFRRIMKAMSLRRLVAEKTEPLKTGSEVTSPKLIPNVLGYDIDTGEATPVTADQEKGIVLDGSENNWYQIRVNNKDTKAVYVTILCIDPDMQINAFPFGPESNPLQFNPDIGTNNNGEANRLEPEKEFVSRFGFEEPYGVHTLIVLATREPSDFSYISQAGLKRVRDMKRGTSQILEFIEDQCAIGTRSTKRPPVPRDDSWSVGSVNVIAEPLK